MWPSVEMLQNEYNMGWLNDESLAQYIGLGLLSNDQFNQITGKNDSNATSAPNSDATSASNQPQSSSSSFNPIK